jgi:predicted RNA-binding protein Jag
MKSMLQEASSVTRAIERAWIESGRPTEFTIKVLEEGERNFLGFAKKPAIVSITYETKGVSKQVQQIQLSKVRDNRVRQERVPRKDVRDLGREEGKPVRKEQERTTFVKTQGQHGPQRAIESLVREQTREAEGWAPEYINYIESSFKELLILLGVQTEWVTKIDRHVLTLVLQKPIVEDNELERMVQGSCSYLLIQLLKKRFKKKFRGFQLVVTVKNYMSDGKNRGTNTSWQ